MTTGVPVAFGVGPRVLAFRLGAGGILAALLAFSEEISALPPAGVAAVTFSLLGCLVALCVRARTQGVLSCSAVYLVLLVLFHFGLALPLALHRPLVSSDGQLGFDWILSVSTGRIFTIAAIGVAAAAVGMSLPASSAGRVYRDRSTGTDMPADIPAPPTRSAATGVVGFAILAASISLMLLLIRRAGGSGLLFGSYEDLITLAYRDPLVPYLDFGLGFGLMLLTVDGGRRIRRTGYLMFGLFALIALPLGMRGTILFPVAAAAVAHMMRRSGDVPSFPPAKAAGRGLEIRLPASFSRDSVVAGKRGGRRGSSRWTGIGAALLAGVALLSAVGALRDIRQHGLAEVTLSQIGFGPLDGLAEMGASLRPVAEAVTWRDGYGEPAAGGRTYTGQLARIIEGRLLGIPQPPAEIDDRLFNTVIRERSGPIGGSPIAEAYYNFGLPGVVAILFVIGLLCGWLDGWRSRWTDAACSVLLVPLLIGVRNDFTPLPMQVLVGTVVLVAVRAAGHWWRSASPGRWNRAPQVGSGSLNDSARPARLAPQGSPGSQRMRGAQGTSAGLRSLASR
ncbi:O-antigen polysaccharide polymerase Wzy [Parafrankia irregularis]|uniref:O-antigen polysaccharide polymerase Wzy n=1 Tax=Parafrankia irregularis TaxID=795642 RepID=A0A0S4QEC8_9ACTN|nr:O-antigen polysaccharide polymerase Wzy [Parafrankia irregularis]